MSETRHTPGPWVASFDHDTDFNEFTGESFYFMSYAEVKGPKINGHYWVSTEVDCGADEERQIVADAALIAAAPDLYTYAEFEERLATLFAFENELTRDKYPDDEIARLKWEKREELFPEISAEFPTPTDQQRHDWCGDEWVEKTNLEVREEMYGDDSSCFEFSMALETERVRLRTIALAKTRGEASSERD